MNLTTNFKRTILNRKKDFYGLIDSYQLYLQFDYKRKIKKKMYSEILRDYSEFLQEKLIEKGIIYLPENTGFIKICGYEMEYESMNDNKVVKVNAPINWKATNELWNNDEEAKRDKKLIYYLNEDTNGVRYSISWSKAKIPLKFKDTFMFIACRHLKRKTSKSIQNGKEYQINTDVERRKI